MPRLISGLSLDRLRHQSNSVYRVLKTRKGQGVHSEVGPRSPFSADTTIRAQVDERFERDRGNAVTHPKIWGDVEIDNWGQCAADLSQGRDWRVGTGFVGHDG